MQAETKTQKVMAAGLSFVAAGGLWFILALLLPVYKLSIFLLISLLSAALCAGLLRLQAKQIAALPPAPPVKVRAEEMVRKLDLCSEALGQKAGQIREAKVADLLRSIADTLRRIADAVEEDPKDRNKVRKLANHYTTMLTDLADQYLRLEAASAAPAGQTTAEPGENIGAAMSQIADGLANVDLSLKAMLDDLFSDDAMEASADIAVLEQLLKQEQKLTINGGTQDE